eukprot:6231116-Pyramimonas_sp.AAC.1
MADGRSTWSWTTLARAPLCWLRKSSVMPRRSATMRLNQYSAHYKMYRSALSDWPREGGLPVLTPWHDQHTCVAVFRAAHP